jgi:hypothetical protein
MIDVPAAGGRTIRLCDFAGAGSTGLRYRSWLPAAAPPPPPPITRQPLDGATIGSGSTTFRWTSRAGSLVSHYRVVVSGDEFGRQTVAEFGPETQPRWIMDDTTKRRLPAGRPLWWKVVAHGPNGQTSSQWPLARFVCDLSQPVSAEPPEILPGPDGVVVRAPLRGDVQPEFGRIARPAGFAPTAGKDGAPRGAVRLNGRDQMVVYALPEDWPEDYSATVWVRVKEFPAGRIGQILSLWAGGMDDPLRLTLDGGKLFARIEAGRVFGTSGASFTPGQWRHVAAVKTGAKLTLYLEGKPIETVAAPAGVNTGARTCALGGNPNYSGNECLAADFAGFEFYFRPLTAQEIAARAGE